MAKFCIKCGSPVNGIFCGKCGADTRSVAASSPLQTGPAPVPSGPVTPLIEAAPPVHASPVVQTPQAPPLVSGKTGMSPLAKLGIAAVVVFFAFGAMAAAGMYYVAHRVSQKIHEAAAEITGSDPDTGGTSSRTRSAPDSGNVGDVCRFLKKEDVSRAIGVEIVRTKTEGSSCSYIAKGTQTDMTAKHVAAMMASRGADQKTQQMMQTFAGGMGKMFESEKPQSEQDTSGEVPVFNFSVDQNAAEEQMRLNAKVLSTLGDTDGLPGIGDQAFVSADGMIMVRKGKNLVRIMYMTCPCGTEAVKPLAKKIAEAL